MPNRTITASVKWFNVTKGFGFLERPDDSDVMLHATALKAGKFAKSPCPGDEIECEITQRTDDRWQVVRVLSVNGTRHSSMDRTTVEAIAERFEARAAVDAVKRAFWIEAAAICREGVAK